MYPDMWLYASIDAQAGAKPPFLKKMYLMCLYSCALSTVYGYRARVFQTFGG